MGKSSETPSTNPLYKRFRELIDKKFLDGITVVEQLELEAIDKQLRQEEEKFYRPILDKLKNEVGDK